MIFVFENLLTYKQCVLWKETNVFNEVIKIIKFINYKFRFFNTTCLVKKKNLPDHINIMWYGITSDSKNENW